MSSLLGWWKLDEASGTSFADASGNGRTLTASGTVTAGVSPIASADAQAVDLGGGYLYRSGDTALQGLVSAWSIGAWINLDSWTSDSYVMGMQYTGANNFGIIQDRDGSWGTGKFGVGFYYGSWKEAYYNTALSTGTTYFLAGTWDGTTLKFYLDGTLVASSTPGSMFASSGDFYVGKHWSSGNVADGRIDEVFVVDGVLTATEIANIYADSSYLGVLFSPGAIDDAVGVADTVAATSSQSRAVSDSVTLSDVAIKVDLRDVADSVTTADSVARSAAYSRALSDSVTLGDTAKASKTLSVPTPTAGSLSSSAPTLVLGTSMSLPVPTARASHRAAVLSFTGTDPFLDLTVPGALLTAQAASSPYLSTGLQILGDDFYNPILLRGLTGSVAIDFDLMSNQPGEGTLPAYNSTWLLYDGVRPGTLRVETADGSPLNPDDWFVETFYGTEVDALIIGDTNYDSLDPNGVTTEVRGPATYVRISQSTDIGGTLSFKWSYVADAGAFLLDLNTTWLDRAPGVLRFSVLGAAAGASDPKRIRVSVVGTSVVRDYNTDASGIVSKALFQLPATIGAGTYTLRAQDYADLTVADQAQFTVQGDPLARPTAPPADLAPALIPQTGVIRWVLQDPMPGGLGSYVVPNNPRAMSDPFPQNELAEDKSTAPDGQHHFWEGAPRAVPWRFSGDILTQEHLEAFEAFAEINRRFYVIDHRSRAWRVTLERFSAEPQLGPNPWRHKYEVSCLAYGEPVQL